VLAEQECFEWSLVMLVAAWQSVLVEVAAESMLVAKKKANISFYMYANAV
jgi:hypothetical protein